ncbi:glycosyltransferase family 2 protein [Streptococcus salivarius]|jgi:eps6J|uniref:Glycosyltransferase n=1 Tax=Streptococcus salivarius TaxID=1304 RepID=A0AAW6D124_STRSL|nr:glycosyltransferase family 2 protein [Streptococcus salivarius]MBS7056928.1 glycosyltransferase [Streptococcus salivarius]MDB8613268.1 glycosyltransferase [Streptococcus salivarius]
MSNIDLSIIVPVYNVENYLRRGLDSILSQPSLIKYEILLIDDDSSDNSGAICDEYQKHYSNVFVTHIENNGVAEARNLGISLSRGNYLYFMDPDDFLSDDFFERISPQFNKKWDVLCFGYNEIKENNNNILSCRSHTYSQTGILDKGEFRSRFVDLFKTDMMYNVWSRVYNKSFILKYDIKFPSRPIGEDTLFNFQVYQYLDNILFIDSTLYNYIAGRSGSALTSFHPKRIEIQLDELQELRKLLEQFRLEDATLIQDIKTKIIISSVFQISNLKLRKQEKIELLQSIIANKAFDKIFSGNSNQLIGSYKTLLRQRDISSFLRRLSIDLLTQKKFRTVIFIEKMKMNPILRKIAFK